MRRTIRRNRIRVIGINPTRFDRGHLKFLAYLIPVAAVMMLPILFIVSNAFKPLDELFLYPPRFITTRPTLQNFANLAAIRQQGDPAAIPVNSLVSTLSVAPELFHHSAAAFS